MKTTRAPILLLLVFGLAACSGGEGTRDECAKDGDCPEHWRCDTYGKFCRCVSDEGCNQAANERCMPDGNCKVYLGCQSDAECGALERCETQTGECLCTHNDACPEGDVCNASGYCQPSAGCFENADCATGEFCDTPSKTCKPAGTCTNKFQCPLGQICHDGACIDGCEDHGDCPLRWACIQGDCMEGVCEDDSFCDFMEYCSDGNCLSAYDAQYAPYCKPCDNANLTSCGQIENTCLIYPFEDDAFAQVSDEYCSVDCSGGQRCPNGFGCTSIITIKTTDTCQTDLDCPQGLPCLKSQEEDQGFCPCHNQKNACMNNACSPGMCLIGSCLLSGLPCSTNQDCGLCLVTQLPCNTDADCRTIECELFDGVDYGGCVSAKGCGLLEGFHCPPP